MSTTEQFMQHLRAEGPGPVNWSRDLGVLQLSAPAGSDLLNDPSNDPSNDPADAAAPARDLGRIIAEVHGDFVFSARISVNFAASFDAGVLLVYVDADHWIKACYEYSVDYVPTVMTVVTRDRSDDAVAWPLPEGSAYLRISRRGAAFAVHSSDGRESREGDARDGMNWTLVRHCTLGIPSSEPVRLGFLAQSPIGDGCTARFDSVSFEQRTLADMRDGS